MAGVVDLIKNYLTTKEGGSGIGMGIGPCEIARIFS